MNKKLLTLAVAVLLGGGFTAIAQNMTDDQIADYATTALSQGKTRQQIATELLAKGATTSQLKKALAAYQAAGNSSASKKKSETDVDRTRKAPELDTRDQQTKTKPFGNGMPRRVLYDEYGQEIVPDYDLDMMDLWSEAEEEPARKIYGHDIFGNEKISFEPNENAPTPENYVLGAGDEVFIDVYGAGETTINQKISPDGTITVPQIGPIHLGGLTISDARDKVTKELRRIYASAKVSLSLGQNRTIIVNVLGDVKVPGSYRLSSFATVFTALHRAGGVDDIGSLRAIKVSRGGKIIATVDLYSYIFDGRSDTDITLQDGDIVSVPAYNALVDVSGKVKRPMIYEMADGESLAKVIQYAGGFTGDAYTGDVRVIRQSGAGQQVYSVDMSKADTFIMADSDSVQVSASLEKYGNKLEIKGAVNRPGLYEFGPEIRTVSQLVNRAGGLVEDAFTGRAQIVRENEDLSLEVIAIALKGIMDGSVQDVLLQKNDVVYIASKNDIEDKGDFTITGYVANPGEYPYADHTSIEDLILLAGGLVDGASSARVDVSRRINDAKSTKAGEKLAEVFSFGIKNGLMVDGTPDFELKPYDVVAVRRSPGYVEQRNVTISGEVAFPGDYTLVSSDETVSELIARAGGPTSKAYLRGGVLRRMMSEYEQTVLESTKQLSEKSEEDTIDVEITSTYTVGVELDKAVERPHSDYDIVLREGDEIVIPESTSTVSVEGCVLYPNTVNYVGGKGAGYYVSQAGGFGEHARRTKIYVVYMNGTVDSGRSSKIEPGCNIIVPEKPDVERRRMTAGEIVSLGTSAASMSAVVITVGNLIKQMK